MPIYCKRKYPPLSTVEYCFDKPPSVERPRHPSGHLTSEEVGLANNGWRVELPIVHLEPARIIRDGSASPAIAWSNLYFVTESDNNKLGVLVGVFHWNGVLGVLIAIFLYWDGGFVL